LDQEFRSSRRLLACLRFLHGRPLHLQRIHPAPVRLDDAKFEISESHKIAATR
jgi:hypothetical protein